MRPGFAKKAIFFILSSALLLPAISATAATLEVGIATVSPGERHVPLPVNLFAGPGDEISAIQFDIVFDPFTFALPEILPGEAADAAGKMLSVNMLMPGVLRVLVAGLNQDSIPEGPLAYLLFDVAQDAPPGAYMVWPASAAATDGYGIAMEAHVIPGHIDVLGNESEGEEASNAGEGEAPANNPDGEATTPEQEGESLPDVPDDTEENEAPTHEPDSQSNNTTEAADAASSTQDVNTDEEQVSDAVSNSRAKLEGEKEHAPTSASSSPSEVQESAETEAAPATAAEPGTGQASTLDRPRHPDSLAAPSTGQATTPSPQTEVPVSATTPNNGRYGGLLPGPGQDFPDTARDHPKGTRDEAASQDHAAGRFASRAPASSAAPQARNWSTAHSTPSGYVRRPTGATAPGTPVRPVTTAAHRRTMLARAIPGSAPRPGHPISAAHAPRPGQASEGDRRSLPDLAGSPEDGDIFQDDGGVAANAVTPRTTARLGNAASGGFVAMLLVALLLAVKPRLVRWLMGGPPSKVSH